MDRSSGKLTSKAADILYRLYKVGLVLPDSILDTLVVSNSPSILPAKSTWVKPLASLNSLILLPTALNNSDFSMLDIYDKSRNGLYLFYLMPYMTAL